MSAVNRVGYIQSLRAIAAILVVIYHTAKELSDRGVSDPYKILTALDSWQFGVDIFFVISGFIMYHVTFGKGRGPSEAYNFLSKRAVRVIPLYWIFTTLFIATVLISPKLLHHSGFNIPYIISSYLFVPWHRPGAEGLTLTPILGLGWTLNYEMPFYILVSTLIALKVRRMAVVVMGLLVAIVAVGYLVSPNEPQVWYWTRSCILEFGLGSIIAAIFQTDRMKLPLPVGIIVVLFGIIIWQTAALLAPVGEQGLNVRGYTWGIAAALIVGGIGLAPTIASSFSSGPFGNALQKLGDASYSLYLCHVFIIRIMSVILGRYLDRAWPVYLVLTVVACIAASIISFNLIERPIIRLGRIKVLGRNALPVDGGVI